MLPSACPAELGTGILCRVLDFGRVLELDKNWMYRVQKLCRVPGARHSAKSLFAECPWFGTRQITKHSAYMPVSGSGHTGIKMAMGTRNPSTRWVLPDKKTGMEWVFYPWVYYWAKSCIRRVWRVRVRMYTTHTRLPAGKKYPHKKISHLKCLTHFSPYGPWIWLKSN